MQSMLEVVLVEPLYQINLGLIARAMKNFGVRRLKLVKPKCEIGSEAFKFAKHSEEILQNANIFSSFDDATADASVVIGTTGVRDRYRRSLKVLSNVSEVLKKIDRRERIALVFGNEGAGLKERELRKCDFVVMLQTSSAHQVLNISHAVAIMLYEMFGMKNRKFYKTAERIKLIHMQKLFFEILEKLENIKYRKKVSAAFGNLLRRSRPSDNEVQALFVAMSRIRKQLKNLRF